MDLGQNIRYLNAIDPSANYVDYSGSKVYEGIDLYTLGVDQLFLGFGIMTAILIAFMSVHLVKQ